MLKVYPKTESLSKDWERFTGPRHLRNSVQSLTDYSADKVQTVVATYDKDTDFRELVQKID